MNNQLTDEQTQKAVIALLKAGVLGCNRAAVIAAAPHLQYPPTRATLSDSAIEAVCAQVRDLMVGYRESLNVPDIQPFEYKEAETPSDAELLEKVCDAYIALVGPEFSPWKRPMTAALKVVREAVEAPLRAQLAKVTAHNAYQEAKIAELQARLERMEDAPAKQPAPAKTPEERVTTNREGDLWRIVLDGIATDISFLRADKAQTYRLGLIAELKGAASDK